MGTRTQKDAVYTATKSVLKEKGIAFEDGQVLSIDKATKATIVAVVIEGFKAGTIDFSDTDDNRAKMNDDKLLKNYATGLVGNWIRKDKRFNGGVTYVNAQPGSRQGAGDEQLKALKALKKKFAAEGDTAKAAEIDKYIAKRISEITVKKAKEVKINMDVIPEELRTLLGA
jgi:hypothetical protein